jgi:HEAT repeat protein
MSKNNWTDDKLLARLCNNKSDKSRWDNITILRKRPSEELFYTCVELTKSKDPKIRSIGIDVLAQMGLTPRPFLKQTLQLYFDLLKSETDSEVLMSLLYSIGHNNDKLSKTQIEKLCAFSNNENNCVKEGLVSALLGINNLTAIETLIILSSDTLSRIRNWATFGLGTQIERNNKNIREALWNRVNDKHQETKLEAIVGLAKRKVIPINEIIKRELHAGEFGTLLFEAIIETGNKEFLPLLRQEVKSIKDDAKVNAELKKNLKNCIAELTKSTNEKRNKN